MYLCNVKTDEVTKLTEGAENLITRDCSNTYIWLLVIFSLDIWNLSYKSS